MVEPAILFGRLGNSMFQMAHLVAQAKKGEIPDWFVQDPKFFEGAEEEIKKLYGDGIGYLPYIGVHLRVGKNPLNPNEPAYVDNPFYTPLVKTGYYIKALEQFSHMKVIVFSDDMDFARTYFEGDRFAFDESATDIEALNKLASCHHKIIANSSFGWWAGYLGGISDTKVICPREDEWYSDGVVRTKVPKEWIQQAL